MPVTVFDAVGKFTADTTNLDQFIAKLERGLPDAQSRAAAAASLHSQALSNFRAAIKEASTAGTDNAAAIEKLAQAEKDLVLTTAGASRAQLDLKRNLGIVKAEVVETESAFAGFGQHLLAFAAATFSIGALEHLLVGTKDLVLELSNLSVKTGISIESLAGLHKVAEDNGIAFDAVSAALVRMTRAQTLALEGGQQQQQAFHRVGIEMQELRTLKPEDLFFRLADAIVHAKNAGDANATAIALMGRSASQLIPIFAEGTEELRKHVQEAAKAAGIDNEAALAARNWQLAEANLEETFRRGALPLMEAIVPLLRATETAAIGVGAGFKILWTLAEDSLDKVVIGTKGVAQILAAVINHDFASIPGIWRQANSEIEGSSATTGVQLKKIWGDTVDSFWNTWKEAKIPQKIGDDEVTTGKSSADKLIQVEEQKLERKNKADKAAIDEEIALAKLALANHTITAEQEITIESNANEKKYQLDVQLLEDRIALWAKDPTKSAAKASELNSQIEALEKTHYAKLITETAGFTTQTAKLLDEMYKSIKTVAVNADFTAPIQARLPQFLNDMLAVEQAFRAVGLVSEHTMEQNLATTQQVMAITKKAYDSGVATLHDYQSAQLKELETERALMAVRLKDTSAIDKQIASLTRLLAGTTKYDVVLKTHLTPEMRIFQQELQKTGSVSTAVSAAMVVGIFDIAAAYASGSLTIGQALEKVLGAQLQALAQYAEKEAIEQIALGVAALSPISPDFGHSGEHFASAALWASLGLGATIGGGFLSNAGSGGGGSGGGGNLGGEAPRPATGAGPGGVSSSGPIGVVPRGSNFLLSQPTLSAIGQAQTIPVGAPAHTAALAEAVAQLAAQTASPHARGIQVNVQGMISDDNLTKVIEKISRRVQRGYATLYSSNSYRTTRRD